MKKRIEIVCAACGADALLRREPLYEGFKRTGERLTCASCGHVYAAEADVPYKGDATPRVFTDADKPCEIRVFRDDERGGVCRYCAHYIVNPFAQRCGLHLKFVEATDTCEDFKAKDS
jgi:hypothetical protein